MLRRHDDSVDGAGHCALVADGDLGLAVGPEEVDDARLPHLGEPLGQPVREPDRDGHELRGLGSRVPEHDALVAGTLQVPGVFARLLAGLERRCRRPGRYRATGPPIEMETPHERPSNQTSEEL